MKDTSTKKMNEKVRLVPGTFSICPHCDLVNERCRKYNIPKQGGIINEIGDWTWENYCLVNGGCDSFF